MFNLYNICLLRAFEHIHMEFARYKCLLLFIIIIIISHQCRHRHTIIAPFA